MVDIKAQGGIIVRVDPGSPAARAGIAAGDRLLAVNGVQVEDLVDYLVLTGEETLCLEIAGADGRRELIVRKDENESLGLTFTAAVFDGIRRCANHCVFCFIDQLPRGLRPSLYVKDEDYRLSFLQGNYITLDNLARADRDRIVRLRLSPLYVSVHATDPQIRGRLLGLSRPAPILPLLADLTAAGIKIQAQAVVCPGWNDGAVLDRTIDDLAGLWPGVQSLAVVPVGLTKHRQNLPDLTSFDRDTAAGLLQIVQRRQADYLTKLNTRFVFAADELYLAAGKSLPNIGCYEDFPQLQNGVGLVRSFEADFRSALRLWRHRLRPGRIRVVTGTAAVDMWRGLARSLARSAVELEILPVRNDFFGESVTVTGLLTGQDIIAALAGRDKIPTFVPEIVKQRGADLLLDGITTADLVAQTDVEVIEPDAEAFLSAAVDALHHDKRG